MRSYIQILFNTDNPSELMERCNEWFSKGEKSRLEIREWTKLAYSCPYVNSDDFMPILLLSSSCLKAEVGEELTKAYIDYAAEYVATRTVRDPMTAIAANKEDFTDNGLYVASLFAASYKKHYENAGGDFSRLKQVTLPYAQEGSLKKASIDYGEGNDLMDSEQEEDEYEGGFFRSKVRILILALLLLLLLSVGAYAAFGGFGKKDKTGTSAPLETPSAPAASQSPNASEEMPAEVLSSEEDTQADDENRDQKDDDPDDPDNPDAQDPDPDEGKEAHEEDDPQANGDEDAQDQASNPDESKQADGETKTANVICLDPNVIIRTGPGMNYSYVAQISGTTNMKLQIGEIVESEGNDGYQWRKVYIDDYIGKKAEGFVVLNPSLLKKGKTYYMANQYIKD